MELTQCDKNQQAMQLQQHTQDHPSLTQIKTKLRRGTGQE